MGVVAGSPPWKSGEEREVALSMHVAVMARGTQISGYEVLGTLGYGAHSTIYAVKDKDNNVFALKRVVRKSPQDDRFLEQAILEHQVAQKLDHPNLRKSYKLIRHRSFIRTTEVIVLMEMVDGYTLEQHPPRDLLELVTIFTETAKALGAMHDVGLVHSDMKPNNVIASDGRIKVIDFGQSCASGTVKQRIQGTPDYIAPEQVNLEAITPRTDVFNLGATMYWLLTKKHVPTAIPKGKPGLDLRSDDAARPPREIRTEVTPALSNLVMDCIAPAPQDRPQTMSAVIDRLGLARMQLERMRRHEQDDDSSSQASGFQIDASAI